ncbi:hotdog fold thioesterase [Saliterribacillus persicus]|uniref:Uncharacterized protein (TIGR00369 family) n=1 Tax=Saliterribacillus persicus TaxID=930114 RepID=A0A368XLL6_9BACI|nr:hotdog fold thioesterase [Saliterribacillus persicus]RCW66924.1 uncharacterized protein (TIGR00369 family) [Saliterribacillus persicus]
MSSPINMITLLKMEIIKQTKELVQITMPITNETKQPMGYLHGGASVTLAETAASVGGLLYIDKETSNVFGIEINANHIKAKKDGLLQAFAKPVHIGKSTMVWDIRIYDEMDELVTISRCTLGVKEKRKN